MDRPYSFFNVPDGSFDCVHVHPGSRVDELDAGIGYFYAKCS